MLEWECCLKHPEDGAREGAPFIESHIIRVTEKAFDDFAGRGGPESGAYWGSAVRHRLGARLNRRIAQDTQSGRLDRSARANEAGGRHGYRRRSDDKAGGRIRLGMVGGGEGAFIGAVHRMAARMDDHYVFVAGRPVLDAGEVAALRRRHSASTRLASMPTSPPWRRRSGARKDGIEAVSIVTPNHMHAPAAVAFIKAGIHVICDKPLTTTLKDALSAAEARARAGASSSP